MANFISFLITCLSCNENDVLFATDVMIQPESFCSLTLNQTIQNKNGRNRSTKTKFFLYRCFSLHLGQIWTLRQLVAIHQGIFPLYWSWYTRNGGLNLLGLHHARLSGAPWRPKHHIRLHQVDRLPLWKRSSGQLFIWTKINREIVSISLVGLWSYY